MTAVINRFSCACAILLALCMVFAPVSFAAEAEEFVVETLEAPSHVPAGTEIVTVTVTGTGLFNGLIVQLLHGGETLTSAFTSGNDTEQTAQLPMLPNETHSTEYYQIAVFTPDGADTGAFTLIGIEPAPDSISVATEIISLDGAETYGEVEVTSNCTWHISGCSVDWIVPTADGLEGTSILTIEAQKNTGDMRMGYIYLETDGEQSARTAVTVEQWGTTDPYSLTMLTDEATGVGVNGVLHRDTALYVDSLDPDGDLYFALSSLDSEQSVLAAYDAQLEAVEGTLACRPPVDLIVPLGEGIPDQPCRIVYFDVNMEIVSVPADMQDGVVTASVENVSPFIVIAADEQPVSGGDAHGLPLRIDPKTALRIALYVLAGLAGLFLLLYFLAIALPKRTLMSADGRVSYYLGRKKLSGAAASFTAWAWRSSADIVLAFKK